MTGHEMYVSGIWPDTVFQYDPADNGPECEVITRILASHPRYVPGVEKRAIRLSLLSSRLEKKA